jgi:hypothetical protein
MDLKRAKGIESAPTRAELAKSARRGHLIEWCGHRAQKGLATFERDSLYGTWINAPK